MEQAAKYDPGNEHAFIYMWGTTGLAYNVDKIKERMPDAPLDSWALLFDPAVAAKFDDCGIMVLDSPCRRAAQRAALSRARIRTARTRRCWRRVRRWCEEIRPYIRKFHSSEILNALANGDICLALMYSGDAGIAGNGPRRPATASTSTYVIPKEGAQLWFDMMAMPTDAPDADNAYAFMNYLLQPEVMAKISNFVTYPNAVPASTAADRSRADGRPQPVPARGAARASCSS